MERNIETAKQHEHSAHLRGHEAASSAFVSLSPALQLQQQAGNQAVQQLLRSGVIQEKLAISNPDDPEEREADQVAQTIMRSHSGVPASTQRSGSHDGAMYKQCKQEQSQLTINRHVTTLSAPAHVPRIVSDVLRSPGQPLDVATRAFMEPRFGHDFSHVRIHADERSSAAAKAINARAYTMGRDVTFAGNQFSPTTTEGKKLLAHELTHVVQQTRHGFAPHRLARAPKQDPLEETSGNAPWALEIYPPEIRFEPTKIGQGTYRQVSIGNHSPAPVKFGGFWGGSSSPVAAPASPTKPGEGGEPAPVREAPKPLGAHYAFDGPFKVVDDPDQHTIMTGGSIEAWVDFAPTKVGTHAGMFSVLSIDGDAIGRFSVVGEGLKRETAQDSGADDRPSVVDEHVPPVAAKDPTVNAARQTALLELGRWQESADKAIVNNHNTMVAEWHDYISKTSTNPVLSIASVPNPAFLAMLGEHTVGVFAAEKAEHLIKHMAEHLAAEGAEKAAAGVAGAEVGSVAGPPGALIGFAIAVLIETVCGMLFHWLSGEDAEIKQILHEQYESGVSEGSRKVGELFKKKIKELDGTENKALTYQGRQRNQYERLITKSIDARQLHHLIAEVEAQTDLAKAARPKEGFADALLELWVREFAAGPAHAAKDVNEIQWEKVAEELEDKRTDPEAIDRSLKQPDLFVAQCLHEWTRRGLAPHRDLETKLLGELAQLGIKRSNTSQAEVRGHLAALADQARQRFDRREFVWTNVFDLRDNGFLNRAKTVIKHGEDQPHVPQYENERSIPFIRKDDQGQWITEGVVDMVDEVLCYPVLATDGDGTCYVDHFDYHMKAYGKIIIGQTHPGGGWDFAQFDERAADPKDKSQQAASRALYELMSKLRGLDLTVTGEPDAAQNSWLKSTFGAAVAVQRSQHSDARPEPVKVYRLEEIIVTPAEQKEGLSQRTIPENLWAQINGRFELAWQGRYLMVRGGDTILIIEV